MEGEEKAVEEWLALERTRLLLVLWGVSTVLLLSTTCCWWDWIKDTWPLD